ncbi:reverse transcriptase [Phytophthora megakarya]|uniref:Reverse transcriptase n=1 Tax=Phytophthora megakarya TaxID=4795 RepID=A0A225VRB0_9STRA|nr:reverse transcriptase [Phytophthora megakarya]
MVHIPRVNHQLCKCCELHSSASRNTRAQDIIRLLGYWESSLNLRFSASHIAGSDNARADAGSRIAAHPSYATHFGGLTRGISDDCRRRSFDTLVQYLRVHSVVDSIFTKYSGATNKWTTKKERFEEQSWDSLKSIPYYEILRKHRDVLPDEIPAEFLQDKGIQHEIDLVPGAKYCVTLQWPLAAPTFCVKKPQGGWHIVHAYNKMNDATIPAQTIPQKDAILDSMSKSTIYSALDLRDGRAVDKKTGIEIHKEHLRELLGLMRKHKLYGNLKKCIFVINEWPMPSNVKDLRQFRGFATYLCKYVDNYAGKIRLLSQLLKKEAAWEWTAECQQAFVAVKLGLTEAPATIELSTISRVD